MSLAILDKVEVGELATWIASIPFEDWPQQHRWEGVELRPAMVNNLAWEGFGLRTDGLVTSLLAQHFPSCRAFQRMLSVVMPKHSIAPHRDPQVVTWLGRVHVPLVTNEKAVFVLDGVEHHLRAGFAYVLDVRCEHAVYNRGTTPRIHFMFDVARGD